MRKNQLIEKLQAIKGNPEIMLWNGFAEDIVPIDPRFEEDFLIREDEELYAWHMKRQGHTDEEIPALVKKREWEFFCYYPPDDVKPHNKKRVLIIQPKLTGKKYTDRFGEVRY